MALAVLGFAPDRFKIVGKLKSNIENDKSRILGVLAGDRTPSELVRAWASTAHRIFAADGGADLLMACGLGADVVIGDLDSVSLDARTAAGMVVEEEDQNFSDCDKLLGYAAREGVEEITLVGAEGSRVDHMLGILQSAARASVRVRVAYEKQLAWVFLGSLVVEVSGLFSLLPLTRCEGVELTGARWELHEAVLDPVGLTSLSNEASGRVEIAFGSGAAVLFVPYDGKPTWE